ncbi:MAG: TRAP transporter small permease [Cytophagales bacterium]|nr:TRAP transporter small permease [Cytophagales bacterium]
MKQKIDLALKWLLIVLMAVLTLDVVWQVCSRYLLQNPSEYTDELARFLMIWVGLLGASYVTGQRQHLAIDILPNRLTGIRAQRLDYFIQICIILFAAVMVIGGLRLMYITLKLGQNSSSLGVPLGLVYSVVPLSALLMIYYAVYFMLNPESADK